MCFTPCLNDCIRFDECIMWCTWVTRELISKGDFAYKVRHFSVTHVNQKWSFSFLGKGYAQTFGYKDKR